jgi:hypothetical protein
MIEPGCSGGGFFPMFRSPRSLLGGHHVPAEVWPHVGAALATGRTHEAWFKIGKSSFVRPWIAADCDRMAAPVVGAVDETANAGRAHVGKGDLRRAIQRPLIPRSLTARKSSIPWGVERRRDTSRGSQDRSDGPINKETAASIKGRDSHAPAGPCAMSITWRSVPTAMTMV